MNFADLKEFFTLIQTFIVPILGYGLYRLNKIDDTLLELRDHLAQLNGRVSTCDGLRDAHERSDKDKHDNCEERLRDVEHAMRRLERS